MGNQLDAPITTKEIEYAYFNGMRILTGAMQGWRPSMEDRHLYCKFASSSLFGVYDGHGGANVSRFIAETLPEVLRPLRDLYPYEMALRLAYEQLDAKLRCDRRKTWATDEGSTAITVTIEGTHLVCANAGDSRAFLVKKNGEVWDLSVDHKPNDKLELDRIVAAGGTCNLVGPQYRVCGNLNLSRALGDLQYKMNKNLPPEAQIISGSPDIITVDLTPDDDFLFLACDGIFDVLSNEETSAFLRDAIKRQRSTGTEKQLHDPRRPLEYAIRGLLDRCLSINGDVSPKGSTDNMSTMIVDLQFWWTTVVHTVTGARMHIKLPNAVVCNSIKVLAKEGEIRILSNLGELRMAPPYDKGHTRQLAPQRIVRDREKREMCIHFG